MNNSLKRMVGWEGIEPSTSGLKDRASDYIHLLDDAHFVPRETLTICSFFEQIFEPFTPVLGAVFSSREVLS